MLNSISGNNFFESNTDYQSSQVQENIDTSVFDGQISAAEAEKSQAQEDVTTTNEEISTEQDVLETIETSMNQLTNVISEAEQMISTFDGQIGQLQSSIGALQSQLGSLVDEEVQTGTDEDGNPIFETVSHEAERQEIQQQIDSQTQQLQETEQAKQEAEQFKQETETEYQNLQTEIEASNMNIEGLDMHAQEAQTLVEEKETELGELKDEKAQYIEQEQEKIEQENEKKVDSAPEVENSDEIAGFSDGSNMQTEKEAAFGNENDEASEENIIKDVGMSEFADFYNDMGVVLYQDNYSEDEQKAAKENLEKIANSKVDENDETAKKFQKLAQMLFQNSDEVSEQTTELQTEMTEASQNYGGGSDQVKDVKEKENALLKQYQDMAMDIAIDICVKEGAAKEPLEAVRTALNELGAYKETDGDNIGFDVQKYGAAEGEAWCMYFINYIYNGVFKDEFSNGDTPYAYNNAAQMAEAAQRLGVYAFNDGSYSPCAGDVFNIGGDHVGMFLAEDDNYYYTIEGNADDEVKFRKYAKPGTSDYETGDKRYDDITGFAKMNEYYGGTSKPVFPNIYPEYRYELATKNGSVT